MFIKDQKFVAIDFESAGSGIGKTDAPIQVATCMYTTEKSIHSPWMSYISTEENITWTAQKVHGITKEQLANAPTMTALWPTFHKNLSNKIIVAHGHGTEKKFLRAFPYHGFGPWLDTITLSKKAFPNLPSYALGDICDTLKLTEIVKQNVKGKCWHDALFDSVASLVILQYIIEQFDLEKTPINTLI